MMATNNSQIEYLGREGVEQLVATIKSLIGNSPTDISNSLIVTTSYNDDEGIHVSSHTTEEIYEASQLGKNVILLYGGSTYICVKSSSSNSMFMTISPDYSSTDYPMFRYFCAGIYDENIVDISTENPALQDVLIPTDIWVENLVGSIVTSIPTDCVSHEDLSEALDSLTVDAYDIDRLEDRVSEIVAIQPFEVTGTSYGELPDLYYIYSELCRGVAVYYRYNGMLYPCVEASLTSAKFEITRTVTENGAKVLKRKYFVIEEDTCYFTEELPVDTRELIKSYVDEYLLGGAW